MNFIQIDKSNSAVALKFLSQHEHTCVQLVERVRLRKFDDLFAIVNNVRTVTGVLSTQHTVLHCLPDAHDQKKQSALKIRLAEFLYDKKISCVNGEAAASRLVLDILSEQNKTPLQVNEYFLMTLHSTALKNAQNALLPNEVQQDALGQSGADYSQPNTQRIDNPQIAVSAATQQIVTQRNTNTQNAAPTTAHQLATSHSTVISHAQSAASARTVPLAKDAPPTALPIPSGFAHIVLPDWHVVRCYENDANALMPLQAAYEAEEVTPACRTTHAAVVRKNLDRLLQTEYVSALQNERGEFVAKANTNAIGMHYAQIGGVYTMPQYRGRQYASLLVEIILHRIIQSKRRPVLYVRTTNEHAKKIYASLGFSKSLGYTIAYY